MKRLLLVGSVLFLAVTSGSWAELTSPGWITVSNAGGAKYHGWDLAFTSATLGAYSSYDDATTDGYFNRMGDNPGLNELGISKSNAGRSVISESSPTSHGSGTFYITNSGGRGYDTEIILLASVQGKLYDDFSLTITSTGYTWTPAAPGYGTPGLSTIRPTLSYTGGMHETFTRSDFIYGPQTTRPAGSEMPLYVGQDTDDEDTAAYLAFIDLYAGNIRKDALTGLINNGAVQVDFTFTGLYESLLAFNAYGWMSQSPDGEGVGWTSNTSGAGTGYSVAVTAVPTPVPPTLLLLAAGFGGIGMIRMRWFKR